MQEGPKTAVERPRARHLKRPRHEKWRYGTQMGSLEYVSCEIGIEYVCLVFGGWKCVAQPWPFSRSLAWGGNGGSGRSNMMALSRADHAFPAAGELHLFSWLIGAGWGGIHVERV